MNLLWRDKLWRIEFFGGNRERKKGRRKSKMKKVALMWQTGRSSEGRFHRDLHLSSKSCSVDWINQRTVSYKSASLERERETKIQVNSCEHAALFLLPCEAGRDSTKAMSIHNPSSFHDQAIELCLLLSLSHPSTLSVSFSVSVCFSFIWFFLPQFRCG